MSNYYRPGGFSMFPVVIKNIMIINALFFLAKMMVGPSIGVDFDDYLGLHHWSSDKFMVHQLVTHIFMHGNMAHILFNMFALWMFGMQLENLWGPKRFLLYYMLTALGAATLYLGYVHYGLEALVTQLNELKISPSADLFLQYVDDNIPLASFNPKYSLAINEVASLWRKNPGDVQLASQAYALVQEYIDFKRDIPMVGASGAVYGILLGFGMLFPNTLLYIYFLFPVKAKYAVIGFGLLELYSGLENDPTDNVAHFAHLGGMLFGYLILKAWKTDRSNFY